MIEINRKRASYHTEPNVSQEKDSVLAKRSREPTYWSRRVGDVQPRVPDVETRPCSGKGEIIVSLISEFKLRNKHLNRSPSLSFKSPHARK